MKTIYQCEICGERNQDRALIEACEAQGRPDLSLCPPVGLLTGSKCGPGVENSGNAKSPRCGAPTPCGSHLCGAGFIYVVQWCGERAYYPHEYGVGFGIFRGNGYGDTFNLRDARDGYDFHAMGKSRWMPEAGFRRWQGWPEAHPCPAFWRAVTAVREAGHIARVVRNGELVDVLDPVPADT